VNAAAWRLTLAASVLMGLAMGGRFAFGLFVSPLNTASGMGLASLSLMLALGQLGVGFAQPVIGAMADRYGAARVIVAGALVLALSSAVPPLWPMPMAVSLALVASAVAGSAVGSNGLLLGEVGRAVSPARAGLAVGLVGAGASAGQLVLGPAAQWAIDEQGWRIALLGLAALSLLALPLAFVFRRRASGAAVQPTQPVSDVLRERRFWRVAASFGVCGFHVAFLAVHMPGVIERCGLPPSLAGTWIALAGAANIAGSIAVGFALKRHDAGVLLGSLYATRALGIAALLVLPVTPMLMLGFAVVMGASHMATLPPTAQLVARQHGVQRLGTLFGIVMLVHQVGSFAGIWLGGWAVEATGSDNLLWCVDAGLALCAAALVWPRPRAAESASVPRLRASPVPARATALAQRRRIP
jgi:predicted MFS family arabinose efflux permease